MSSLQKAYANVQKDPTLPQDAAIDVDSIGVEPEQASAAFKMVEKANYAVALAKKELDNAKSMERSRMALDTRFMDNVFPYDTDDGKYTLCAYCGFGGEMICCEGCSRVSHIRCANLKEIPEVDWFCHACSISKSEDKRPNTVSKKEELMKILEELKARRIGSVSNGKIEEKDDEESSDDDSDFDYWNDRTERLSSRSATRRAIQAAESKVKKINDKRKSHKITNDSKIKTDISQRKRGRPSKNDTPQEVETTFVSKRKRGRPRKNDQIKEHVNGSRGRQSKENVPLRKKSDKVKRSDPKLKPKVSSANWCPSGWSRQRVQRVNGISAGQWDTFWISPDGRKFRSRGDVERFISNEEEKKKVNAAMNKS